MNPEHARGFGLAWLDALAGLVPTRWTHLEVVLHPSEDGATVGHIGVIAPPDAPSAGLDPDASLRMLERCGLELASYTDSAFDGRMTIRREDGRVTFESNAARFSLGPEDLAPATFDPALLEHLAGIHGPLAARQEAFEARWGRPDERWVLDPVQGLKTPDEAFPVDALAVWDDPWWYGPSALAGLPEGWLERSRAATLPAALARPRVLVSEQAHGRALAGVVAHALGARAVFGWPTEGPDGVRVLWIGLRS